MRGAAYAIYHMWEKPITDAETRTGSDIVHFPTGASPDVYAIGSLNDRTERTAAYGSTDKMLTFGRRHRALFFR